ncbi:hypothetical protein BJX65DRAFT_278430 [Aspergillus insuetus]
MVDGGCWEMKDGSQGSFSTNSISLIVLIACFEFMILRLDGMSMRVDWILLLFDGSN